MKKILNYMKLENKTINFSSIHSMFSETRYGKCLADKIRYDRYKPGSITNTQWEKLLGADVNNLKHMPLTYGLTRQFIKNCSNPPSYWTGEIPSDAKFSAEESELLLLAAIMHDWGEAVVGDKMFDLKTRNDEKKEIEALESIIQETCGQENQTLISKINSVVDTIIKNKTSKLGKAFNAVERVGYMRTALTAWNKSKTPIANKDFEMVEALQWLTHNVLLNQIPTLISYSEIYPAVSLYLNSNAQKITEAFVKLPDTILQKYNTNGIKQKKEMFKLAKKKWMQKYFLATGA